MKVQLYCGGAALEDETVKYFESRGFGLVNFYGTTEATGPISTNVEGKICFFFLLLNSEAHKRYITLQKLITFHVTAAL